jgi:hypothetical protein
MSDLFHRPTDGERLVSVNVRCSCGLTMTGKVSVPMGVSDPAPDKVFPIESCPACMGEMPDDYSSFEAKTKHDITDQISAILESSSAPTPETE